MKRFKTKKVKGKWLVWERSIWTLFFWQKWENFGGSFGNWDIEFDSLDEALISIGKYSTKCSE